MNKIRALCRKKSNPEENVPKNQGAFADINALKDEAYDDKPYDVFDFYYKTGVIQRIAKSDPFTNVTLGVISINAIWMGYDTDKNDADTLEEAEIQFQIAEQFFAVYFTIEWSIRFLAFERKCNGLKDGWFKFDSFLCILMWFETWILPALGGGLPIDVSMLRLLRLLRLSRLMRLLRKCPELITLLKGMAAATRSVFSTLILLLVFMYIFSIIFRQQADGNEVLGDYFGTMGLCFWTLLMQGTLLDDITGVLTEVKDDSPHLAIIFLLFVLIGNFTVLNMLIGVLCEVVSAVAAAEKEKTSIEFARDSFIAVMTEMDADGSGTMSIDEFETFVRDDRIQKAFEELDVDPDVLVELSVCIFEGEQRKVSGVTLDDLSKAEKGVTLEFGEVLEQIMMMRFSNVAMVKDITLLRKYIQGFTNETLMYIVQLFKMQMKLMTHLQKAQQQQEKPVAEKVQEIGKQVVAEIGKQVASLSPVKMLMDRPFVDFLPPQAVLSSSGATIESVAADIAKLEEKVDQIFQILESAPPNIMGKLLREK